MNPDADAMKILDAMNELNYRPNAIARSLVLQKTNIIGVIMDSLCQAYYFDFIKGIEQEIEKSSYEVLFCSARDNVEAKKKYVDFFSQGRTDGFIMYGSNVRDHKLIEELERQGHKVPEDVTVVGFDNYLYPGLPDRRITTYEVDMKGLAQVALKKILKRMEDPEAMKRMDLVAGHIVEKDSVRPPRQGETV